MHSERRRHGSGVSISGRDGLVAKSSKRDDCLRIIESGLAAAMPDRFIPRVVGPDAITAPSGGEGAVTELGAYSSIHVLAFGKAAGSMTAALKAVLQDRLEGGLVILPKGLKTPFRGRRFRVMGSRHPVPDKTSVRAAKEAVKFLQARRDGELVIFLISGGGSSLLALPDGITLGEKIHVTEMLLRCGAAIGEINCVRSCLSQVKGGKLAGHLRCDGIGLVMSDVQGDDPAVVASGPTTAAHTRVTRRQENKEEENEYGRALGILDKYRIRKKTGTAVIGHLVAMSQEKSSGVSSNVQDAQGRMIGNYIIAKNTDCLESMAGTAAALGYTTAPQVRHPVQVFGDIKDAADTIYDLIPKESGRCVIFGGEPTVRVLGSGTGGRNQEMVLRLLKKTQKLRQTAGRITMASVGTDGIDGNSLYAGAIADNSQADVAAINDAIRKSDSTGFFERRRRGEGGGSLPPACIRTGPTHANLMDIGVILT